MAVSRFLTRLAGRLGDRVAAYAFAAPDVAVLIGRLLKEDHVPKRERGEMIACALYILSPVDVVPEALFGPAGAIDDAAVAARLLDVVLNRTDVALVRAHWPGDPAVLAGLQALAADLRRTFAAGLGSGLRLLFERGARRLGLALRRAAGVGPPPPDRLLHPET